jgi:hypothetical protein
MAEAYPKFCQAESMVEVAGAKVAWTLPLLRNERQLPNAKELLPSGRETRL